jgi:L-ascorbate metabolism protein UlaG (beta-lactamase superfamily)
MTTTLHGAFTVEVHHDDQRAVQMLRPVVDAADAALRAGADPLRAVESRLTELPVQTRALVRPGAEEDDCLVSDEVLYPRNRITSVTIDAPGAPRFRVDPRSIPVVSDYLRCAISGEFSEAELRDAQPQLTDLLAASGGFATTAPAIRRPDEVGVFRMQHAGLLYQSSTTRILVDPHFHSCYAPELSNVFDASQFARDVDAVLVSHSHSDHLSLGSLLFLPRDTPIVVPYVPRGSVLCPDLRALLGQLGFTDVRAPRWYDAPVVVGDIEVYALPFYGEQPLASEAWPAADVRNWGNTYCVRAPEFVSLFLIDSGNDTTGRMCEVAAWVRAEVGPVDYLASNLGEFCVGASGPRYIASSGSYFLTLSRSQMRRFASFVGESLTLGPDGVAECCRACDAKYFLPYAHWWGEPYRPTPQEIRLVPRLAARLHGDGDRTTIVPWRIGERVAGPVDEAVYVAGAAGRERSVPLATLARGS